jgi:PncC family amidohydrolase
MPEPERCLQEADALAAAVGERLQARGARVAVAETSAGGFVSARLLAVPGASAWFDRGIVAYSAAAKLALGLDAGLLKEQGAVSVPVVAAMAQAMRASAGVDYAVAESGIAGPLASRRSPKPVGSAVIAVAGPRGTVTEEHVFPGARVDVMAAIARRCLEMLLEALG